MPPGGCSHGVAGQEAAHVRFAEDENVIQTLLGERQDLLAAMLVPFASR